MVNTWKIVLAALVIFAAGVFTGGVTVELAGRVLRGEHTSAWGRQDLAPSYTNAGAGNFAGAFPGMWKGPGSMRIQLIRRVEQSLDLSQIQKDKIDLLTKDAEQTLRTLWTPMGAQVQRELRGLENRIDEVLTPDQKATFHDGIRRRPQDVRSPSTTNGPTGGTNLLPATNGSAAGKSS